MLGYIAVKDALPVVRNDEEAVENVNSERRYREEIHCREGFTMIVQKGYPSLCQIRTPGRFPHPAQDRSLRNIEAQHHQLTMNPWCAPGGVFGNHAKDEFAQFFDDAFSSCAIPMPREPRPHWTLALIERLKPKASEITLGRLRWVLYTAMPLGSSFVLYLNGEEVKSSKASYTDVVRFKVSDLPKERLVSLSEKTGDNFHKDGDLIRSSTLKLGVSGEIRVTERTLPGKSDDLLRSHGFFVRV
jgi:hypothetical protein